MQSAIEDREASGALERCHGDVASLQDVVPEPRPEPCPAAAVEQPGEQGRVADHAHGVPAAILL